MAGEIIQGGEFAESGPGAFNTWDSTVVMTTPTTHYFFPEGSTLSVRDGALVVAQGDDGKSMIFAARNWQVAISEGMEFRVVAGDDSAEEAQIF